VIRTGYPISPITKIKLRLELAAKRTRRAIEERRRSLLAGSSATATENDYLHLRWREEVLRERSLYREFYDQFDNLVALLCLAAHEGLKPGQEAEYRTRRVWFCDNYPTVKKRVHQHLESDSSDTLPAFWGRRSCDAFEALFHSHSIEQMLETDNGNLIGRLIRTQEALAAWDDALTEQEKKVRPNTNG